MRYLGLISFLFALCLAANIVPAQSYMPAFVNSVDSVGLYQMNIEIENTHFSGVLLLKKMNDSAMRLVMNSELGPKLLDMELYPSRYKLNHAFPKMNHKRILKTFYDDFGALFQIIIRNKNSTVEQTPNEYNRFFDLGKKRKIIYTSGSRSSVFTSGRVMEGTEVISRFLYELTPGTSTVSLLKLEHQRFTMIITLTRI